MNCWHLTFASAGRHALFPDEAGRRAAVHKLAMVAGQEMVLFCIVDDHVHVVVLETRTRTGRLARAIVLSLGSVAATQIESARIRPVETRSHLQWLVRYLLTQTDHHGLTLHPALWSGSCFQDLVGARVVPGLRIRIREALPRLRLKDVFQMVGLAPVKIQPAPNEWVRSAGAGRLVAIASAALCAAPALTGNPPTVVTARRAVAQIAHEADMAVAEVAWALGVSARSVRRLLVPEVQGVVVRSVRIRLSLENMVQSLSIQASGKAVEERM